MSDDFVGITVFGLRELDAALKALGDRARPEIAAAAVEAYEEHVMAPAKELAPRETGALAESGFVNTPVISQDEIIVTGGFGKGVAEDYAVRQHEDLTLDHPDGGEAKFLEKPATEFAGRAVEIIGRRLKERLGL